MRRSPRKRAASHWPLTCAALTCAALYIGNFASADYDALASLLLFIPVAVTIFRLATAVIGRD